MVPFATYIPALLSRNVSVRLGYLPSKSYLSFLFTVLVSVSVK